MARRVVDIVDPAGPRDGDTLFAGDAMVTLDLMADGAEKAADLALRRSRS